MLKTINSLQGVNILSKQAQKKVQGGVGCGVIFQSPNGGQSYVVYISDENGNGRTKDDAISWASNGQGIASLGNGLENTGHWCCNSCSNFPTMP
jgi:hypothetical protein